MVEFKRKKGESFEGFLRRFNKTLIRSQKLKLVRSKKYTQPKKNKAMLKQIALVGMKLREKNDYLRKIGKIKDEPRNKW
jgi:ribosomal protein S21